MSYRIASSRWTPVFLFIVAFVCLPLTRLDYLAKMPGDVGDASLNNYFLENIYLYFSGKSHSLWNLGFFYPFPYVLGFSDNLFGAAPIYMLMRLLSAQPDTAFQLWFLFAYAPNFAAAYYALRKLGASNIGASVGALIFAFALPTTAHAGHAQLHYRFGLPLAIAFFFKFLDEKEWRCLAIAGAWLAWQFYCGVYIGFFTLFLLVAMLLACVVHGWLGARQSPLSIASDFLAQWKLQERLQSLKVLAGLSLLLALLVVLFYPYLQVSRLYEAKRPWSEIASMLPRPQSYFLSDASYLWSTSDAKVFRKIPMRHEHQMFVGAIPLLLALLGFFAGRKINKGRAFPWILGMLMIVIGSTLYIGGFSIWQYLYKLPLASAIRAMSRLDLAILFPVAYLAAVAIDRIKIVRFGISIILAVVLPLLILEFSATRMQSSFKEDWRARLASADNRLKEPLLENSIIFFSQNGEKNSSAAELDAMWVAQSRGVYTLNGYSGFLPVGYSMNYGNDCSELPRRIISYLAFAGKVNNDDEYRNLMKRVVPVGFDRCAESWFTSAPKITAIDRSYTPAEIRNLSYVSGVERKSGDAKFVDLKIKNSGGIPISAISAVGTPVRISWRFLDSSGAPSTGFEKRVNLPFDIPSGGDLLVSIPIESTSDLKDGSLQFSLVQDGAFWAHDVGVQPITIPWK